MRAPFSFIKSAGAPPDVYDPADDAWTLWVEDYGGSPWEGIASAGSSGTHDLTEATNPPAVGASLNGLASADFDGTNDILVNASASSVFIDADERFVAALIAVDATGAGGGTFGSANYIGDNAGFWGHATFTDGMTDEKIDCWDFDGATKQAISDTITLATPMLVCAWQEGGNLYVTINGGAPQSAASGNISAVTGTLEVGNGFSANFLNGQVWMLLVGESAADALTMRDNILEYVNDRFDLSLS